MDAAELTTKCEYIELSLQSVLSTLSNSDWNDMNEFGLKMAVLPILFHTFPLCTIHSELRCKRQERPGYIDVAVELAEGFILFELKCMGLMYWEEHENLTNKNFKQFVFYEKFAAHAKAKAEWFELADEKKKTETFAVRSNNATNMLNVSEMSAVAAAQICEYSDFPEEKVVLYRITIVSFAASVEVRLLL